MKHLTLIAALFFTGCAEVNRAIDTVEGLQKEGISASIEVETNVWSMKVIDDGVTQTLYLMEVTAGILTQCIVYDPTGQTIYSPIRQSIPEQDALRTDLLTTEQLAECVIN